MDLLGVSILPIHESSYGVEKKNLIYTSPLSIEKG